MANHRKIGPKEEKKIIKLRAEGNSAALIARLLNVNPQTVLDNMRRLGLQTDRPGLRRKHLPPETLQTMREMYACGDSCEAIATALGMKWVTVNRQLKRAGVKLRPGGFKKGTEHHCWAGGRSTRPDGYVQVLITSDSPFHAMGQVKADETSYVLEHRLVLAEKLGRVLRRDETVHHIDGNRRNNDVKNLQLRTGKHGKGVALRCVNCGSCNIEPVALESVH